MTARAHPVTRFAVRHVKPRVPAPLWEATRSRLRRAQPEPEPPRPSLTQLARRFGTDKWGRHRYTQHYERYFGAWRDEAFSLLEIGVGGYRHEGKGGASLQMWKAFFPHTQVVGLDIEDKRFVEQDRIKVYVGSQVDAELLHRIEAESGPFRIIVDDGSHRPEHIRETFALLFPLLETGGYYVIEDTQTSYWPEWGGSEDLDDPTTTMALVKSLLDGLNHEEFRASAEHEPTYTDQHVVAVHAFHNLVIIEKGLNNEVAEWKAQRRADRARRRRKKRRAERRRQQEAAARP